MFFPDPDSDGATRLTSTALAVVLVLAVSAASYFLFESRSDERGARVMHSLEVIPHAMAPGQKFKIRVTQTLTMLCPFELRWSLISEPDHVERLRIIEPVRPAHTNLGADVSFNDHFVPADVRPGQYNYSVQVFDECPGRTYVSSLTAPFLVITGPSDVR
jgi:hypothetical protein